MIWMLRLYPRAWRRRYGAELEEVIASQPSSIRLFVDLLGGAVDAHLKPQAVARHVEGRTARPNGGLDVITRLRSCGTRERMSTKDGLVAAGFALATAFAVAGFLSINRSQLVESVVLSMFPAFLIAPTQWIFLRGHSRTVKLVLIGGPVVVCFLIGLTAGLAVSD